MKLNKSNHTTVSESREVAGLVSYRVGYEVKSATGAMAYYGPRFTPEMWHQILSFFRWTHHTMNSECQVRLYVNLKRGQWGAWAFPQAARTGMTARELPVQETPEQARERFASWHSEPSDDWMYFGTVHHHCTASAFQSSVDEQNEANQDGLHLTVGRMEAEGHDLHARFYLQGNCFEPDLSAFWTLDPELAAQVPPALQDALARHQMGRRIELEFPEAWRKNLVEVKGERRLWVEHWDTEDLQVPLPNRVDRALEEVAHQFALMGVEEDEWVAELETLGNHELGQVAMNTCVKHGVTLGEILRLARTLPVEEPFRFR